MLRYHGRALDVSHFGSQSFPEATRMVCGELGTASDVLQVLSSSWSRYEESDEELKRLKETIDCMGVDKSSFRLAQLELRKF